MSQGWILIILSNIETLLFKIIIKGYKDAKHS